MKKIPLIILCFIIITSCTKKIDRHDITYFAKDIIEVFKERDLSLLQSVYETNLDSINDNQKEHIANILNFFKDTDIKYLKFDTVSGFNRSSAALDIYFLKKNQFYKIRTWYSRDSNRLIIMNSLYFNNLKELCEEDTKKPYCPTDKIAFKSLSWKTDYSHKSFKSGEIILQNNSGYDLDYIKFRVILKHGTSYYSGEEFFNQTVESNNRIFRGDINRVQINGLEDFFTGFEIEKNSLQFNAELIEVLPKPISSWCEEITKLETQFGQK